MHYRNILLMAGMFATLVLGLTGLVNKAIAGPASEFSAIQSIAPESSPALANPLSGASAAMNPNSATGQYQVYLPFVTNNLPSRALWRFGVGDSVRPITDYSTWLPNMRFGWYINWGASTTVSEPFGIEYVQVVNVKQWKFQSNSTWTTYCFGCPYVTPYTYTVSPSMSQIAAIAAARPGKLWLLGNEIENRDTSSGRQDEILPELYAQAYHDLYTTIKQADPTALVANGSEIEPTPLRLKYLDIVWNTYLTLYGQPMPVDVWNMHLYVFAENCATCFGAGIPAGLPDTIGMTYSVPDNKNFSIAAGLINNFRTWLKQHGQQNKPMILSEYGVSIPDWVMPGEFTPEQIRDSFMYPSFDYFLNHTDTAVGDPLDGYRLVQRWNTWSMDYDVGSTVSGVFRQDLNGNLFFSGKYQNPLGITTLGTYYQQYIQSLPPDAPKPAAIFTVQPQALASLRASAVNALEPTWTYPMQCSASEQVQLLDYAPSRNQVSRRGSSTSPVLKGSSVVCAVHPK